MTIGEQLREKQKQRQDKGKKKREEKVDWLEIMGVNRQTYKRGRGGAIRRK